MTSVLAKVVILHFSWYHEYIAPIFSPICIAPWLPPFDYQSG